MQPRALRFPEKGGSQGLQTRPDPETGPDEGAPMTSQLSICCFSFLSHGSFENLVKSTVLLPKVGVGAGGEIT